MSLTQTQIQSLQHLLHQQKANLTNLILKQNQQRSELSYENLIGTVADSADAASADSIFDVDNALANLQQKELNEIQNAEQRIAQNEYGICLDCDREISYARLQAYPAAQRCTYCQNRHEHLFAPHSL